MCDYSLHHVKTRDAVVGDALVSGGIASLGCTHRSWTRGFYAPEAPDVAVCLRPGTELAFDEPVRQDHLIDTVPGSDIIDGEVAVFMQIDLDRPNMHHDALEFPNGRRVKVQSLLEGQRCRVLQLPAEHQPECVDHQETVVREANTELEVEIAHLLPL